MNTEQIIKEEREQAIKRGGEVYANYYMEGFINGMIRALDKPKKEKQQNPKNDKVGIGEYFNIHLTDIELNRLQLAYGMDKTQKAIEYLSAWGIEKPQKFKEYKNHYLTLRRWVFKAIEKTEKVDYKHPTSIQKLIEERQK